MPERPLVLFVATRNNLSGASRSMLDLIAGLRAREVEIQVALNPGGPIGPLLDAHGIPWIPCPTRRWIGPPKGRFRRFRNRLLDIQTARRVASLVRARGVDLVHTNTLSSPVGAMIAERARLPHVWHMREAVDTDPGSEFADGPEAAARFIERTTARVFCVSDFLAEQTARYAPRDRIRRLYNGPLDPARAGEPLTARRSLDPAGTLRLLTVGVIGRRKGQEEAIRAVGVLRKRGVDARLSLAGEGNPKRIEILQALTRELGIVEAIDWLGYVDPAPHYAACDLTILPGPLDPLPRVAIESLGAGVPTVALRSGGIPEIIDDGETGWLYDAGPENLADAIERAVRTSPAQREEMRQEGHCRAYARFNRDRYADDAVALYREIGLLISQVSGP